MLVTAAYPDVRHPAHSEYVIYYNGVLRYWCNISAIPEPYNVTWSFNNTEVFVPENKTTSDGIGRCANSYTVQQILLWATDDLDVRKAAANSTLVCSGESALGPVEKSIRLDIQCKS